MPLQFFCCLVYRWKLEDLFLWAVMRLQHKRICDVAVFRRHIHSRLISAYCLPDAKCYYHSINNTSRTSKPKFHKSTLCSYELRNPLILFQRRVGKNINLMKISFRNTAKSRGFRNRQLVAVVLSINRKFGLALIDTICVDSSDIKGRVCVCVLAQRTLCLYVLHVCWTQMNLWFSFVCAIVLDWINAFDSQHNCFKWN